MSIYVASSWRNQRYPRVIEALTDAGIDRYDFRNPPGGAGFSWGDTVPAEGATGVPEKGSDHVSIADYQAMLAQPKAQAGFKSDMDALRNARGVLLVLPCGKSAHLELGYATARAHTAILLEEPCEPELMYLMVDALLASIEEAVSWCEEVEGVST